MACTIGATKSQKIMIDISQHKPSMLHAPFRHSIYDGIERSVSRQKRSPSRQRPSASCCKILSTCSPLHRRTRSGKSSMTGKPCSRSTSSFMMSPTLPAWPTWSTCFSPRKAAAYATARPSPRRCPCTAQPTSRPVLAQILRFGNANQRVL